MASLLDVANVPQTVDVNGVKVVVYGISAEALAVLMARFPSITKLMSGMQSEAPADRAGLLKSLGPGALAAFIAAGCGGAGDEEQEKIAAKLGLETQLDLIDKILRMTFPRGVGPFVDKLHSLGLLIKVDAEKVQTQLSQDQSQSSSEKGTSTRGDTPLAK